jgi:mannose-1-phosphate guanylyltransferase
MEVNNISSVKYVYNFGIFLFTKHQLVHFYEDAMPSTSKAKRCLVTVCSLQTSSYLFNINTVP